MTYRERAYRRWAASLDLEHYRIVYKETDLWVSSTRDVKAELFEALLGVRAELESYIAAHPGFLESLEPVAVEPGSGPVVSRMAAAGAAAGVGPMAAVAGAVAEAMGRRALELTPEIMIENGGDLFLRIRRQRTIGLWAGDDNPFTGKVGFRFERDDPFSVCSSSGRFGHSLSRGRADCAVVISADGALADACATALGNMITAAAHIEPALERIGAVPGVEGAAAVVGDRIGAWGAVELVPIRV